MALFSSTQNTAALSGGLRYRPMTSAAFSSNSGIGAGHIAAQSMGLDSGASPHASHPTVRNAQMSSQLSGAPMSRAIGRRLLSRVQNPGFLADDLLRDNLATTPRIQTRQASFNKTLFPPSNEVLATAFLLHDGSIRLPGRQSKDYLRTPPFSCLHPSRSGHSF